ncbi:tRNA lysidine(34) synthetase TilS [Kozakia baliensis]|uniref:tRNA(Ile)-lysidine synthase n=1 Tax=Kozakia baliensis TaxID=153496 RepID=A0A1D8URY4_9PROT|nr:tRNA lysidine(34) synthetase TilS [Kozakia baliensis]AOX16267.1 hypothetical protein A0U89_03055 [Kozakia baliensis]GBR28414.1 Ile-tRNA lysidine synthase [Kozakia baliensis NRIC 0488]GEL63682.1 tRNA(Ile)-lysidine synthase [Kozakia baliensis]
MAFYPVGAEEFAALMTPLGPFLPDRPEFPMAVAVSGGADSLCLAWLLRRWRRHIHAFIVDHGLRQESSEEARNVARQLDALDIPNDVLSLSGLRRDAALQTGARMARYDILKENCRQRGILDLLVAHHADDQSETIAIRANARSGPLGLAGMALCREGSDIRILRPLLSLSPLRLRATLRAAGLDWVEDPSNRNAKFERVRVRQNLTDVARRELAENAAKHGRLRNLNVKRNAEILSDVVCHPLGFVRLPLQLIEPPALAQLWRMISGAPYLPDMKVMEALVHQPKHYSFAGAMLYPAGRLGEGWLLSREPAAVQPAIPAMSGALWDKRWNLRSGEHGLPGCEIGALGTAAARYRRLSKLPALILQALPTLCRNNEILAIPSIGFFSQPQFAQVRFEMAPPNMATDGSIWQF